MFNSKFTFKICSKYLTICSAYIRRSSNTLVITELIHKSGNLITFLHDRVFEQVSRFSVHFTHSRVEYFLAFLEASEVIFELAGSLAGGDGGRWAVIAVIQVLK